MSILQKNPAGIQNCVLSSTNHENVCAGKLSFFLNKNTNDTSKEICGFKSKQSQPHVKGLNEFEDYMVDMIQRVEVKTNTYSNDLQKKLRKDVKDIQEENNIFVKGDKRTKYYKTAAEDYVTLVNKNVMKTYKKTNPSMPDIITLENDRKSRN